MKEQISDFGHAAFSGLIGVAREDVTPPVGIYSRNWGAAKHDVSSGIHRPLSVTCVTFQASKQEKPLILISADFGLWRSSTDGNNIRNDIMSFFSVPPSHLMFCLTHTHSGPVLSRDDGFKPGGDLIDGYLKELLDSILKVIKTALSSATLSVLTWNYGKCNLAKNRDLFDPAINRFVTGFNPQQEADDTLLVGRITNSAGKMTGTIVNYACHPTTLAWQNELTSPDYVGAMREVVTGYTGAPCLFLQGASGDLAPKLQYSGDTDMADKNGRQLGYSVLAAIEDMLPPGEKLSFDKVVCSGAALGLWKLTENGKVSAMLRAIRGEVAYNLKALPKLDEIVQEYDRSNDRVLKERLWRLRCLRINLGDGDTAIVYFWIWKIGDAWLVGQPNEAYSGFQVNLRKALSGAAAVINLVNGSAGYLVPRELYGQKIYQVEQTPFAAGSLEQLYNEVVKTAEAMNSRV